jgi:aryl-alcohol dehydrogenase-like predicted oxidoreductase
MNYLLLGKSGLRVSELCLGTMTMGEAWGWGADKATSLEIYKLFREAGGNFIDTANRYTEGQSEEFLGEFMQGERDQVVLATKYSLHTRKGNPNDGGNHRKNLRHSVEGSLRRLRTDYIDLLYLHAWDFTTSEEEVLRSLDDLVSSGKVLYLGISDTPAWIVSRMDAIAALRGWAPFVALQIEYNLLQRTVERDLTPMARALDLGVAAWAPLAGGALTGKYKEDPTAGRLKPESARLNERARLITDLVVEIAGELGCSPAQVALNWVRQRPGQVIPIFGGRKTAQISDSLGSLAHSLSAEQIARLDAASAIELGFPHDFLATEGIREVVFGGMGKQIVNHHLK